MTTEQFTVATILLFFAISLIPTQWEKKGIMFFFCLNPVGIILLLVASIINYGRRE